MFFIRHGQSTFNVVMDRTGRDPQIPDAPLSDLGQKQVRHSLPHFQGRKISRIIASPYTRAIQTALIVAEALNMGVEINPLVGERRLYSCDIGSPVSELKKRFPALDFSVLGGDIWWPAQNESARDVQVRLQAFMMECAAEPDEATTLVVSHYYFINAATGACPDNAEVISFG